MNTIAIAMSLFFSKYALAEQMPMNVKNIISNKCISCHASFQSYTTNENWLQSGIVVAGQPGQSNMIKALKNFGAGGTMPKNANLSDQDYQAMRAWISSLSNSSNTNTINSVTPFQITLGTTANKYPKMNVNTELLRYNRCYAHLARTVVPKSDTRVPLINSKAINGTEACLHLLESSKLDSNGQIKKDSAGKYTTEAKAILKTMNDFHRSWFPTYDYTSAVPTGECFSAANYSIFYNGEMALHLTNALFNNNVPYSSIVTNNESFEAQRDDRSSGAMTINNRATSTPLVGPDNNGVATSFTPKYMTTGDIVGLKTLEPEMLPNSIDFRSSAGAGVLGTVPYLLLNSGRNNFENINGGLRQHRRWSKAVFSDILCRDIPVVRSADAVTKVQSSSALPFRQGISCMQCHSSIDPMAQVQRNRTLKYSNGCNTGSVSYTTIQTVDKTQETVEQVESDNDFYRRPPKGHFYFRTYDGKLLNQEVTGVDGMGEYMATVDDLYICAAKRYFQFFTGIDVPMYDAGDFSAPKLSAKQSNYRQMVIDMGLDLKKNQNLEILINKIISSQAYINPGIGED